MHKPAPEARRQSPPGQAYDRKRALGADLLERSNPRQLPDRAKAIAVLRRANELITFGYPDLATERDLQQALDVAARDVGLSRPELGAIVRRDVELEELERRFLDGVRAAFRP